MRSRDTTTGRTVDENHDLEVAEMLFEDLAKGVSREQAVAQGRAGW